MIYKTKDYGIFHLKTENRSLREDILSNLTDSFKKWWMYWLGIRGGEGI